MDKFIKAPALDAGRVRYKELVTHLYVVTCKERKDEIFFPREVLAAQEYYHKCLQAGLSPTITKKDVH